MFDSGIRDNNQPRLFSLITKKATLVISFLAFIRM